MTLTRKGQATRERILEAAVELIAQRGAAGTSTEDVRKAAGISGSQLYHYFDSKQALIRAVITRQAEAPLVPGQPIMGALDSLDALQAWADAAVENQQLNQGRGDCILTSLAGELSPTDEQTREDLCNAFQRWQGLLYDSLQAMRDRGELRPETDLDEVSMAMLAALQGGSLLSQTLQTAEPMRASMKAALAYVRSFTPES
ncbi:TetR/AcrR family transcriptional regulator [Actinoplanes sp. NPDC049265]|uniref:TetR/AcrR family transcriptional regulator n=1 Tax=Actinoplanes sp. NPDC049265 TaxID=3363902 RepID=UPI00371D3716